MDPEKRKQRVVVVGAGPVGSLAALYAANRGDQVDVYELRSEEHVVTAVDRDGYLYGRADKVSSDLRYPSTTPFNFTRSINLALSERGINAMKHSGTPGLLEGVIQETIPMYGRMIHTTSQDGALAEKSQQYDINRRAIHAIDRGGLNRQLLDALEALPNVTIHFNHKLTGADFKRKKAWFEKRIDATGNEIHDRRPPEIEVEFDFMIGADGAHSSARYHLMKFASVDYSQEYIDTLWCEFHIEPDRGSFAMSPNHLHIWPGSRHMFIAIPSMDRTFTCTLFAPRATFSHLAANPNEIPQFFHRYFPGVSPERIAPNDLIAQFTSSPHLPLISLKCSPYHFNSSLVIVGDAAHAMVPFYGQGMNAGLEDVRVLFEFLDTYGVYPWDQQPSEQRDQRRARALEAYTNFRVPDATAINELALANYIEMRSKVVSPIYLARKVIEEAVSRYFPSSGWTTQYTRVSFSNERYSHVVNSVRRQGNVLYATAIAALLVLLVFLLCLTYCFLGRSVTHSVGPSRKGIAD